MSATIECQRDGGRLSGVGRCTHSPLSAMLCARPRDRGERNAVQSGRRVQSNRPVMRARGLSLMARPRRRWDRVSWWYSTILLFPILLWLADGLFGFVPDNSPKKLTISVTSQVDGAAIAGATVMVGDAAGQTDNRGRVRFAKPNGPAVVQVVAAGFSPAYGQIDGDFAAEQGVALRPDTLASTGAASTTSGGAAAEPSATTGPSAAPTLAPDAGAAKPSPSPSQTSATGATTADPGAIASGTIVDADGNPIYQATIRAGNEYTRSKRDGTFTLKKGDPANGLLITASGYKKLQVAGGTNLTVAMERQNIEAVYLTGNDAGDNGFVDDLIALIDRTEINAVVIDIKEGTIFYDTKVQFFQDAGAVAPTYDPAALVKKFHDKGIYTIARLVVFNDPIVAEARQDLAVKDENGGVWKGANGGAWVNPFKQELWQPNIDLAVEAAGFGFDEIQYDYVRFPSDGDLTTADFGPDYTEDGRVGAIVDFLKQSHNALAPTGAMLGADVFGIVAIYGDDQGIGQRFADIAKVVDYICPMVYPSHFDESSIDVGGPPNAKPYETIALSMQLALEKMPGMDLKLRPWLQDFTLGDPPYGADEVRAQITATEDYDTSGWMLWNAGSTFTEDALKPQ